MMTEERRKELVDFCENVLAAHVQWGGDSDEEDLYKFALAALTQPAGPALKLPDELQEKETDYQNLRDEKRGFNAAIAEVKRLNAPHTAPMEPMCATGGAEWVKCCDGKPDIDVTVWCYGQYDDGSDDTDNYAFPGYMDKKGRWFACNNGDYVDGGYGNDYRACVARWMSLPAAPEDT